MTVLTQEQAVDRCLFWQGVLRLKDWDIELSVMRRHELHKNTALGSTTMSKYRRALVRLVDPCDYTDDDWPIERDMEATLVHELLHLHFFDLGIAETDAQGNETPQNVAQERAIETIARALVGLTRLNLSIDLTGAVFS